MQAINTNLYALNAQRSYARSAVELGGSLQRLSTGQRINSARDDAAGLAIAERLGANLTGLNRAGKNANDAIALLQVADGALSTIIDNFQRIRELAVQSANGSNNSADRQALQQEANALVAANLQIAGQTQFNGHKLLDGSFSDQFQIGANVGDSVAVSLPALFLQPSTSLELVNAPLRQVNANSQVSGALGVGDLTLDGVAIGASSAGVDIYHGAASAFAVAAAVTAVNVPGVTASASTSVSGAVAAGGNVPNGGLTVNGVAIGAIPAAGSASARALAAAGAIAAAGVAGVSADASGGTLTLSAADGRDIVIGQTAGGYAASLGLSAISYHGTLNLSNVADPSAAAIVVGGNNPGAAGLASGALQPTLSGGSASVLQPIGSGGEPALAIDSAQGAADALSYLDGKIDSGTAIRALLGATQNRLGSVVDHLQQSEGVVAAARSRIRDTDYASESAQLTRGQILQQAAAAMVAQANVLPNNALILLR